MAKPKDMSIEEWRAKERARKSTSEYRERQAARMRNWKANPKNIERCNKLAKEKYHASEEFKQRRSKARSKWASTPTGKEKRSADHKRSNEKKKLNRKYDLFMSRLESGYPDFLV